MAEPTPQDSTEEEKQNRLSMIQNFFENNKSMYIIAPVLLLVFFLPVQWAVNGVADWFRDHHILYHAEKEGLISVASPQLFTRERLINQRLAESDWIDARIKQVDDLIENDRFSKPDTFISNRSLFGEADQVEQHNADKNNAGENNGDQLSPLLEFRNANEYRQYLVREKFQSVLDDAHDTSSNTLQRLNFNLTISPARHHSRAVAAVSITLEEPKDPEWILQKYGELLFDVRDELRQTAKKMIGDRKSLLGPGENYHLLAETEGILRDAIEVLNRSDARSEQENLNARFSNLTRAMQTEFHGQMVNSFLTQLKQTGLDPMIETAIESIFFGQPPTQNPPSNRGASSLVSLNHRLTAAGAEQQNNTPEIGSPVDNLIQKLERACNLGYTSIWALLPREYTAGEKFRGLEKQYSKFIYAYSEGKTKISATYPAAETTSLGLRQVLSKPNIAVSCAPSPEQVAHIAMLQVLGDLSLRPSHKSEKELACTENNVKLLFELREFERHKDLVGLRDLFGSENSFREHCGRYWHKLREIGVVRLVEAELRQTPIDTSGRLRRLDDYFEISTDSCDLHSCQLAVRTKSEHYRVSELKKLDLHERPADPELTGWDLLGSDEEPLKTDEFNEIQAKGEAGQSYTAKLGLNGPFVIKYPREMLDKRQIEQNALIIGRQEALRLFAELSCYASARSYTVYPREGLGENVLENREDRWSLPALFGQDSAKAGFQTASKRVSRQAKVLGIGDTGVRIQQKASVKECSSAFLAVLNLLEADRFAGGSLLKVEKQLAPLIKRAASAGHQEGQSLEISKEWTQLSICVLHHFVMHGTEHTPSRRMLENCKEIVKTQGEGELSKNDQGRSWDEFNLLELTASVSHLRQRKTTISWLVYPDNALWFVSRHTPRNIPLSAIVSLPSWWPGVQITTETCWLRPKRLQVSSGRTLCPAYQTPKWFGIELPERPAARSTARVETRQIMPLPFSLDDVLPKLGFFLVRFPYIDRLNPDEINLETGREVQLRLTGKRLWKNPRVRIGEQWNSRIEVLPDMEGILATFECLEPLPGGRRVQTIQHGMDPIKLISHDKFDARDNPSKGGDRGEQTANGHNLMRDMIYSEERPVQVWTSEGKTQQVAVTVNAFRPRHIINGQYETPCWADKDMTDAADHTD